MNADPSPELSKMIGGGAGVGGVGGGGNGGGGTREGAGGCARCVQVYSVMEKSGMSQLSQLPCNWRRTQGKMFKLASIMNTTRKGIEEHKRQTMRAHSRPGR